MLFLGQMLGRTGRSVPRVGQLLARTAARPASRAAPTNNRALSTRADAALLTTTWKTYLATGRGCEVLFSALDANNDGRVSLAEVESLVEVVGANDVRVEALECDSPST